MKFENKEMDKEILDRLADYGVFIRNKAPQLNKEKALVLLGEAMLEKFVKEFVSLWKNELFPGCLLTDYEASSEEVHEWIHGGDLQPDCKSSLNNCKEVVKMESNIQDKLGSYLELFEQLKQKTGDDKIALSLITEISKDRRMEEIRQEKEAKNAEPATERQKKFMKKLGMDFPKNATKKEASVMIDEELSRNGNGE